MDTENTLSLNASPTQNLENTDAQIPVLETTRARKIMRIVGYSVFALFFLAFFTLMKLPEDRIKNYIDGSISAALAEKGITFRSQEASLSFLFGVTYTMKGVVLNFPPPTPSSKIDQISFSPSIFPLILGKRGGFIKIVTGDGYIKGSFSMKDTKVSLDFKMSQLDLGKLGVLPLTAGITGSSIIDGNVDVSGDSSVPSTFSGNLDLQLSKLAIEPQSIMGFSIPRIVASESVVKVDIDKGKAKMTQVRIGKPGSATDDLQATITGDISLLKTWEDSTLNLTTKFSVSQTILKSFVLLDAILGAGKQPDGSYAYRFSGSLYGPMPTPIAPGQ